MTDQERAKADALLDSLGPFAASGTRASLSFTADDAALMAVRLSELRQGRDLVIQECQGVAEELGKRFAVEHERTKGQEWADAAQVAATLSGALEALKSMAIAAEN